MTGDYLNNHVSLERRSFDFGEKGDHYLPIGTEDIEIETANHIKNIFQGDYESQRKRKKEQIESVIEQNPQYKRFEEKIDLKTIKMNASPLHIKYEFEKIIIDERVITEEKLNGVLEKKGLSAESQEEIKNLLEQVSLENRDDLARYIVHRKVVLEVMLRALEVGEDGKYVNEDLVHSMIFPTKTDSTLVPAGLQNVWVIDERLNFTQVIRSDQAVVKGSRKRPDIFAAHNSIAFRGENDKNNPITLVEFKKPGKTKFIYDGNDEDPIKQIVTYRSEIVSGKIKTDAGLTIETDPNSTPFYGYIVVELTPAVKEWFLKNEFKYTPDAEGFYRYFENNNLFVQVLSWQKLVKDAKERNELFFKMLHI